MSEQSKDKRSEAYTHSAGGWGSLKAVTTYLLREGIPLAGPSALRKQNKPGGFACVSCAWAKPEPPHPAEFCENGAKATAWEITAKRTTPEFFLEHGLRELETWSDHALEDQGRLTAPLRYDANTDRYLETSWAEAFQAIG